MDKEQIRLFQERWRAIREVETRERRSATPAVRWNQVNAIYRLALSLGLVEKAKENRRQGASNWVRIKENLEVS